jgi:hypothetical protein
VVPTSLLTELLALEENGRSRRIASAAEWPEKVRDIRRRIDQVLGAGPNQAPPLDPMVHEETRCEGYVRRLVSYSVEPDERVRAFLLVPDGIAIPAPTMLCLHQTTPNGKKEPVGLAGSPDTAYAHHLAQRGYVCLAPDHVTAGERTVPGLEAYDTREFYRRHPGWSAVGKGIWDAARAVDHLVTLPEVDKERIGVIGHSLGGHSSIFAAAFDTRLKACVSNCGLTTFADNPQRTVWCRDRWYVYIASLRPRFLAGSPAPFDFHEMVSLIAPRAFLNISSLTDTATPLSARALQELAARVREVYQLLGAEDRFAVYFHDCGHTFPAESRALAYGWLDRQLGHTAG